MPGRINRRTRERAVHRATRGETVQGVLRAPSAQGRTLTDGIRQIRQIKQDVFLQTIARTASVTVAAKAAKVHRDTHYEWLKTDLAYKGRFGEAVVAYRDGLQAEASLWARVGIEEPIVYQGEIMVDRKTGKPLTVRCRSERILLRLLEAWWPEKYGSKRHEHAGPGGGPIPLGDETNHA